MMTRNNLMVAIFCLALAPVHAQTNLDVPSGTARPGPDFSGYLSWLFADITLNTPGKPIDFLGLHIETTHSHFIPPAVGLIALVGGIVLRS